MSDQQQPCAVADCTEAGAITARVAVIGVGVEQAILCDFHAHAPRQVPLADRQGRTIRVLGPI